MKGDSGRKRAQTTDMMKNEMRCERAQRQSVGDTYESERARNRQTEQEKR
jgi:hypothetical protein